MAEPIPYINNQMKNRIDQLIVYHLNVQNLVNKINKLELLTTENKPDAFCITETWSHDDGIESMHIPGFKLKSYYNRKEHIHGGTAIYVQEKKISKPLNSVLKYTSEMNIECCGIEMNDVQGKLAVISIYRPPSGDFHIFMTRLTDLLTHITRSHERLIICGDLNIDALNKHDPNFKLLSDIMESFDLKNYVDEHTRVSSSKSGTSSTSIDYMITNMHNSVIECKVSEPYISDHYLQALRLKVQQLDETKEPNVSREIRCLSTKNLENLQASLKSEEWNGIYSDDPSSAFQNFLETFGWHYDITCPKKRIKPISREQKQKWVTKEILHKKNELINLHYQVSSSQNPTLLELYKKEKKTYRKLVNRSKVTHNQTRIDNSTNKQKEIWKIINESTNRKKHNETIQLKIGSARITDPQAITESFATYFTSIVDEKILQHFHDNMSQGPTLPPMLSKSIFMKPVTHEEISSIIKSLKNKKSTGFDGVPVKVLKAVSDEIKHPLQTLANKTISSGVFPSILKIARVVPVFKKGDPLCRENYRPISILSTFSKIFERVLYNRLMEFLIAYHIIRDDQHGFRTGRSTETATFELMEFVHKELEKGRIVFVLFFDLSRAFDTLNLDFVEQKLHANGIRGIALESIMSFLRERKILVCIDGYTSNTHEVNIGAAQGSVLAPLIFTLFVNDLTLSGMSVKFADDTSAAISAMDEADAQSKITKVCEEMEKWCFTNRIILNQDKTITMHFYKTQPKIMSETTSTVKFLGSYIDPKLTWEPQIDHVCKKLNQAYFALLKLKNTVPLQTLLTAYYALVYPHLAYNIVLWGQAVMVDRIFIAQKRIIRLVYGLRPLESCRELFKTHKILTLTNIYILSCAKYVNNNRHKFAQNADSHSYQTRHGKDLAYPRHNTARYEKSPYYACVKVYNHLPKSIRDEDSRQHFRSKLKKFLHENVFYNLKTFLEQKL